MTRLVLLALLVLGGCSYRVADPEGYLEADCHNGAFTSFCVINVKPGQTVVGSASGIVPAIGGATGGLALIGSSASLIIK
jgi:hypothetical protein